MQKALKVILTILSLLLFLAGAITIAYPHIYGFVVDSSIMQEASEFLDRVASSERKEETPVGSERTEEAAPLEESVKEHRALWEAMVSYNEEIYENKQTATADSGVFAQSPFTLTDYDLENEIFGVLSIPAIKLEMPILLGASNQNMIDGCAVLNQTSMPIGGINTNSVIGGHRGYQGAEFFLHVPDLMPGDEVIITNLWETLTYIVVDKYIIDPYAVEEILIQEGKDMVTLMTCHPYASGGKQRYLIYCERNGEN